MKRKTKEYQITASSPFLELNYVVRGDRKAISEMKRIRRIHFAAIRNNKPKRKDFWSDRAYYRERDKYFAVFAANKLTVSIKEVRNEPTTAPA